MTDDTMISALVPCPWCAAGETQIRENGKVWTGMRFSEPASVSVFHWCTPVAGQPSRAIERIGRDHESAIAAWNHRPTPTMADALAAQQAVMRQALDALVLLDDAFCADDYSDREGRIRGRKALTNSRAAVASLRAALSATQEKP